MHEYLNSGAVYGYSHIMFMDLSEMSHEKKRSSPEIFQFPSGCVLKPFY